MGTIRGFFKREKRLNCSKCGRSWAVSKELGKTPNIFIMQRISALPAGQCPNCGKLYCQGCARFIEPDCICPTCGRVLKVTPEVVYVVHHASDYVRKEDVEKTTSGRWKICKKGHSNSPNAKICWKCGQKLD